MATTSAATGTSSPQADRGVRNHLLASRCAAPLLVCQRRGLIITTTFWDRDRYLRGNLFYDLAKAAMNRLAFALAEDLRPHGAMSLAVSPERRIPAFEIPGADSDQRRLIEAGGARG